ncbi:unnamed protein product [Vitrella brassicaformis CCMP3155]|uniref:Uncharacterized protein n=1 Tax=Vitrella brassicaformis (strain CCMP3155) TaxID=1169540 RepID=A0A0G4GKA8_VITBC|nr:unnamed protein product [Vitrella brassicaformis CCMP3155]|eukprot:CEM30332.1 unnamed protein product [Vitrella brassicaformis CCMP3155]
MSRIMFPGTDTCPGLNLAFFEDNALREMPRMTGINTSFTYIECLTLCKKDKSYKKDTQLYLDAFKHIINLGCSETIIAEQFNCGKRYFWEYQRGDTLPNQGPTGIADEATGLGGGLEIPKSEPDPDFKQRLLDDLGLASDEDGIRRTRRKRRTRKFGWRSTFDTRSKGQLQAKPRVQQAFKKTCKRHKDQIDVNDVMEAFQCTLALDSGFRPPTTKGDVWPPVKFPTKHRNTVETFYEFLKWEVAKVETKNHGAITKFYFNDVPKCD